MTNFLQHLRELFSSFEADAPLGPKADHDGVIRANKAWKAHDLCRRIEIMVTGDPSRVGVVADAVDEVQEKIFKNAHVKDNLEMRITGFLDGCIHRSKWSKKLEKAAAAARHWHCEQSKTKFTNAFENSAGEMVDVIVLIGHRFDDDMQEVLRRADELKQQGVRIHCFHTGNNETSRVSYEKLAEATGGVFLQLTDQSQIGQIMPMLLTHLNDEAALLPVALGGTDAEKLMKLLLEEQKKID